MRRLLTLVVALAPLAGCASLSDPDVAALIRESVEITADDLAVAAPSSATAVVAIDLEVAGYEQDPAPLLDSIVRGFERHPGLVVANAHYEGGLAWRPNGLRALQGPPGEASDRRVRLACRPRFAASGWNGFIAFPGMIAFLPMWLGYGWEMKLDVEWSIATGTFWTEETTEPARRRLEVSFREKNAHRSALFHLWPSTGFYGTQFVLGLVLATTFWFYDAEETTPLLVRALEPRLGWTVADWVRRDLGAASSP